MTPQEFIIYLKAAITKAGTSRALAKKLGISESYLSDVIIGRNKPGPKMLKALKLKREFTYKRIK